eukprot:3210904-Amphidinium_carterae.1
MKSLQTLGLGCWFGDKCDKSKPYIGNDLRGSLPSGFFQLRDLWGFSAPNTHLEGSLPDATSELRKLGWLQLSQNRFRGTIPKSFGRLTDLAD